MGLKTFKGNGKTYLPQSGRQERLRRGLRRDGETVSREEEAHWER